MRVILGLDPSLSVVGYCILTENKKIKKIGQYRVKKNISIGRKINSISNEIIALSKKYGVTDLAIENIYYSKNAKNLIDWARLHGGILLAWIKEMGENPEPIFIMANKARPKMGIKGNAQKIEVQVKVGRDFRLIPDEIFYSYCGKIGNLIQQRQVAITECKTTLKDNKDIDNEIKRIKRKHKYQMGKLSEEFEVVTKGIGEHLCDAIVVANAYLEDYV